MSYISGHNKAQLYPDTETNTRSSGLFTLLERNYVVLAIHWLVYTKTIIHVSVGEEWSDIYLAALRLSKYLPLFTSTLENNC